MGLGSDEAIMESLTRENALLRAEVERLRAENKQMRQLLKDVAPYLDGEIFGPLWDRVEPFYEPIR